MKISKNLVWFSVILSILMLITTYFLEISPILSVNDKSLSFSSGCTGSTFQKFKSEQFPSALVQEIGWPLRFHSFNIFEKCGFIWYPFGAFVDLIIYFWINILIATIYRKIESDEDIIRKPQG